MAVLSRARAIVVDIARGYLALPDDWSRRLWLGDDFRTKLDKLAVMVAAHDYAVATSRDRGVAALAALPQFPLLPSPIVDAPPLELVLELRFFAYQLDIDSLADDDAVDLAIERDWCDFWYGYYARQLDAS